MKVQRRMQMSKAILNRGGRPGTTAEIQRPLTDQEEQAVLEHDVAKLTPPATLLEVALRYIDRQLELRCAERADCSQQIAWLQAERQKLIDDALAERRRHEPRER